MRLLISIIVIALCSVATADPAPPVQPVKPTPALSAPMAKLAFMRGVWAGPARGTTPDGKPYAVTQTERMGPMLGGDVIVIEGRGYNDDKTTGFNAFAVVSWDPMSKKYELRSYAQGMAGTFELKLTADGYTWEIPAGPGAIVRFTATVKGDTWREVGEYIAGKAPPKKTFEMNLKKVGDTDWRLEFHPKTGVWGAPALTEGYVAEVPLKLSSASSPVELMTISLANDGGKAQLKVEWGTMVLAGDIGVK